jgi:hypothetical protein
MQTRLQGCWMGVRRGATFGAKAAIVIWIAIIIVMLSITLVVPQMREHALADLEKDWGRLGSFWAPLYMIGGVAASFGLMAIYGVVGGVLVMGIAGYLRPAQAPQSESNGDSAK